MINPITKCAGCGIPWIECLGKGKSIGYQKSSPDWNPKHELVEKAIWDWYCDHCLKEMSVNCSHCDESIEGILPDSLDDGSFLCKECDTKLNKELEEIK